MILPLIVPIRDHMVEPFRAMDIHDALGDHQAIDFAGPEMESGDRGDCGIATRSFGDFGNNKTAEQWQKGPWLVGFFWGMTFPTQLYRDYNEPL